MQLTIKNADEVVGPNPPPLEQYGTRFLAEGDSWFTLGDLNPFKSSNLLFGLDFAQRNVAVNCGYPGKTLRRVVEQLQDLAYDGLLRGNVRRPWDAILLSAGGNDLIAAAQVPPIDEGGQPVAKDSRLLLTPAEAAASGAAGGDPARYISDGGWKKLADYFRKSMEAFVARRDSPQSQSQGRPIFVHTYAKPVVGLGGVVGAPRGWLLPAFEAAGIAEEHRQQVSDRLFERLRDLIIEQATGPTALPNLYVFDTSAVQDLAHDDWANEIHLKISGYRKLGRPFGAYIDKVMGAA